MLDDLIPALIAMPKLMALWALPILACAGILVVLRELARLRQELSVIRSSFERIATTLEKREDD